MTEQKKYEAVFRQKMPGQVKENEYSIYITGADPVEAQTKAIAEWKRMTEPRDIRVKEVPGKDPAAVTTAS